MSYVLNSYFLTYLQKNKSFVAGFNRPDVLPVTKPTVKELETLKRTYISDKYARRVVDWL